MAKRIEPYEAESMDRTRMGVALWRPGTLEVEPQCGFPGTAVGTASKLVECPWCSSQVLVPDTPDTDMWWTCGVCGGAFTW